jgi:hypothetical protein
MAKSFKIQINPTFKAVVKVPRVGADALDVQFTFKVKDRKELAKMFGEWKKAHEELVKDSEEYSLEDWAEKEIAMQVKQLKDIVVGWGFDDEFNDENIEALVSSVISVTDEIQSTYNEAYTRARSGN